jgi:hypothetical protein
MSNESNNQGSERKNLVMALIAGVCGDAILSAMTMTEVTFSIFPLIALILSVQSLYKDYLSQPVAEDFPLIGLACFFVGAFGHSAFLKAQYPHEGSNFISITIVLALLLWIGKKLGYVGKSGS